MSKKGKKVWERVYNERTSYLMLLPNIIMFAVFTVYPILWALRYMLFDYRGYGEAKFVGMDNFVRVFTRDPVFWDSVVNTFPFMWGQTHSYAAHHVRISVKHAHQRREPVHCFYANHYVQRSDGSYLLSAVQYIQRRDQPFSDVAWRHR